MSNTTDEYRVDLKVRNNLLLTAIEKAGYKNVSQFAKATGMRQAYLGNLLNLKISPLNKDGYFSGHAQRIAEFLGVLPEDLWSPEQLHFVLPTNKSHFNLSHKEMMLTLARQTGELLDAPEPDAELNNADRKRVVGELLDSLPRHYAKVLRLRFGIDTPDACTLEEIGSMMGSSRERIRQIEAGALRMLKRPDISKLLSAVDDREEPYVDFDAIKKAYEKAKEQHE